MRKFATGERVNRGAPLPLGVYFRNLLGRMYDQIAVTVDNGNAVSDGRKKLGVGRLDYCDGAH